MKYFKSFLMLLLCFVPIHDTRAEGLFPYNISIPDSINEISNVDSLAPFLYSTKTNERLAAIVKLGNLERSDSVVDIMVEIFENEQKSINSEYIKYHLLISMGKIGGSSAEQYLLNIASNYSANIDNETQAFSIQDSMSSLLGAFQGLYQIGSNNATEIFQFIYENEEYYWFVRSKAYDYVLMTHLRSGIFITSADSVNYLINEAINVGPSQKLRNLNGEINTGFIRQRALKFLLFQYREISEPILAQKISELPPDDLMLPELEKLKNNMENNPPNPGN